jgi:polar amino acid transport system substrate-binding protein
MQSELPTAAAGMDASGTTDLGGKALVIGTDATYRPFEFVDQSGAIVGIDPDLMEAICGVANCTATFQNTSWDGIFAALAAREFDALMSAITILPEREEQSDATFTEPYFEVGQVVLVKSDSDLVSPEDVAPLEVGVQTGTTGDTAATDDLGVPADTIHRYDTIVLAVEALRNGDIDAVVLDNPTAETAVRENAGAFKILGEPFTTEDYGILVPNASPELLSAFNAAIGQLKAEGRIDAIVQPWYAQESG